MPGVDVCGRCGSRLGLRTLAIDVHPPRAGALAKRLRRWLPLRSAYYGVRDAGRAFVRESGLAASWQGNFSGTVGGLFARAIVPGWPQFYLGQKWSGRLFLGSYLGLMFLALLLFGTTLGMLFAGLAFSVHVSSCVSVLRWGGLRGLSYWNGVVLTFLVLGFGLYAPAGWLLSHVVWPAEIRHDAAPFEHGDVVLYSPGYYWFREPRPGDVVLYERPSGNFRLAGNQHGYIRVAPGQWIERILAGPGDHVRWENGRLTVNGQAALFQPLNSAVSLPSFSWDIPQEHYLILSAIGGRQRIDLSETDWRFLIVVPRSSIHGRVFLRSYPFTRVQRIS
jgi:signal peptidase I